MSSCATWVIFESDGMNADAFTESLRLLCTRRFGTFWFARLLSNIGTWAQQVAQPWLLLSLGASPFLLGLDSFALAAPVFLLTLIGGALADARDRRRTIVLFQSVQMMCPVLIVLLLLLGAVEPWMIIALSMVVGVTDGLSMPSFQSIVPSIVEKQQIPTGIALNSTQFNLSRILWPASALPARLSSVPRPTCRSFWLRSGSCRAAQWPAGLAMGLRGVGCTRMCARCCTNRCSAAPC
jgi:MFS family permease